MPSEFCPGYGEEPFATRCRAYESADYPQGAFRVEWGPVFHRGRLDGSARVLVIGQDPATEEALRGAFWCGRPDEECRAFCPSLVSARATSCSTPSCSAWPANPQASQSASGARSSSTVSFRASDLPSIPARDLPPGLPEWMQPEDGWAKRVGSTAVDKRRTMRVVVPEGVVQS